MELMRGSPTSRRAVVVDDDEACRTTAAAMLEELGYSVAAAASHEEAMALVVLYDPHVLLTDWWVGTSTSAGLLDAASAVSPDSIRLIMSGCQEDHGYAARAFARAWLPKPLTLESLRLHLPSGPAVGSTA